MGLPAGRFDQRIRIERKSVTRAANGEEIVTWVTVAEVWAAVEPLRSREWFAAAQTQSSTDHRVTIRYRSGIERDMRVIWIRPNVVMDIIGDPIDIRGKRENLELMCASGMRSAI